MPYEPHADLRQPDDTNAYIWRFVDLPKFLDLITSRTLYFRRGDQFDDPYEGMMPDEYVDLVRQGRSRLGSVNKQIRMFHHYRADFFVNCWHLSDYESAAMWKMYAGVDAGIALRSTYSRLRNAFDNTEGRFYMGLSSYDPASVLGTTNPFKFIMWKRRSFEHEKETRVLIWKPDSTQGFHCDDPDAPIVGELPTRPGEPFVRVPVDVQGLVTEVIVSPTSPPWLADVLVEVLKTFGYTIPLRMSAMNELSYLR